MIFPCNNIVRNVRNSKFNEMYMELCKELSPFIGISVTKIIRMCLFTLRKHDMNCDVLMTILSICRIFLDILLLKLHRNIIFLRSVSVCILCSLMNVLNIWSIWEAHNKFRVAQIVHTRCPYGVCPDVMYTFSSFFIIKCKPKYCVTLELY